MLAIFGVGLYGGVKIRQFAKRLENSLSQHIVGKYIHLILGSLGRL